MFDVCAGVGLEGGLEGGLGGDGVVRDVEDGVRSQSFEGPGRRLRVLAPMDTCGGFVQYFTCTRLSWSVHVVRYMPRICIRHFQVDWFSVRKEWDRFLGPLYSHDTFGTIPNPHPQLTNVNYPKFGG